MKRNAVYSTLEQCMSCPARRRFSTRLEHSRDSTKTCSSGRGEGVLVCRERRRFTERRRRRNSAVPLDASNVDQSVIQGAKKKKKGVLCRLELQLLLVLTTQFIANYSVSSSFFFLPGDTSPVSDRCRHSAACPAGPA